MDLVTRYIAAVQRELPAAKREEIARELQANIMDELDALTAAQGALSDADVSQLLKQMGHPRQVARQFVPEQPFINASYMPIYRYTLTLVLGILFLIQVVKSTFGWLSYADVGLISLVFSIAAGWIDDACFAFTAITLGYFVISKQTPEPEQHCWQNWQPENLPSAGFSWQTIALQDIFTDLASYLFLLVVIFYPLWQVVAPAETPSVLLSNEVKTLLLWCTPLLLAGICNSLWQLKQRIWQKALLQANIIINALFTLVILYLAMMSPFLQITEQPLLGMLSSAQVERSITISLAVLALFPAWEVLSDSWRWRQLS